MMTNALLINPKDNVITVTEKIDCGKEVVFMAGDKLQRIQTQGIPAYHKVALCDIEKGEAVVKYGEVMAIAACYIKKGEHVHTQNVRSKVQ